MKPLAVMTDQTGRTGRSLKAYAIAVFYKPGQGIGVRESSGTHCEDIGSHSPLPFWTWFIENPRFGSKGRIRTDI